jgi:hypothetical protein
MYTNVPTKRRPLLGEKLWWLCLGIFVPKWIVYVALDQHISAKKVWDVMMKIRGIEPPTPKQSAWRQWQG